MNISLPSETIFHQIESTIKEYRRFAQSNISKEINNLTIDQGMVLLYLAKFPSYSQQELAELLFKDNASMTRMIDLMVKNNFLKRSINPNDRRRFKIEITSRGKEILDRLPGIIHDYRNKSLTGISAAELDQLSTILQKIKANCQ